MKYRVSATPLRHALSKLARVVGKTKSSLPILSHVMIEVEKKESRLRATNLDVHLEVQVPITNGQPFSRVLPFKELKAAVPSKRDDFVTLRPEAKGNMQVNTYAIEGMLPEEFPSRPERVKATLKTQVKAGLLEAALLGVLPAASTDVSRQVLTGVALDLDTNHIVATDGHRLHVMPFEFGVVGLKNKKELGIRILPVVAVEALIHCLDYPEATVEIAFESDTTTRFSAEGFTLWTKQIEGSYPNWQQVIDRKKKKPDVELPRQALIEHTRSMLKLGRDHQLTMVEHDRRVDVSLLRSAGPPTAGRGFPVKGKLPRNAVISFNPRYVLNAFESFTGDLVQMSYSDPLSPCVFADSGSGLRIVVMPVRTNDKRFRVIGDRIVEGQRDPKAKKQEEVTTPATAGREEAVSRRKGKARKGKEVLTRKPFERGKRELKAALKEKKVVVDKLTRATKGVPKTTITPQKLAATLNPTFALEGQIVQFENETYTLDQIRIRLKDVTGKIRGGRSARAFLSGLTMKKAKPGRKK